jgi:hypothetical protein
MRASKDLAVFTDDGRSDRHDSHSDTFLFKCLPWAQVSQQKIVLSHTLGNKHVTG